MRFLEGTISEALFDLREDPDERANLAGLEDAADELRVSRDAIVVEMARLGVPVSWFQGKKAETAETTGETTSF